MNQQYCIECGRADGRHQEFCTRYLSPKDLIDARRLFAERPRADMCTECGRTAGHNTDCPKFLSGPQIAERSRVLKILRSWHKQRVLTARAAQFLQYAISDGQEVDLRRGPTGTPFIEWGGVRYEVGQFCEEIAVTFQEAVN